VNTYRKLIANAKKKRVLLEIPKLVDIHKMYIYIFVRKQRRKWVESIKVDLVEIGWDGVDWVAVAQDRDK
jgi:hypothetical protein